MPIYMFDFWCLPYLFSRGLSKEQVKSFGSIVQEVLIRQLEGGSVNWSTLMSRLVEACPYDSLSPESFNTESELVSN